MNNRQPTRTYQNRSRQRGSAIVGVLLVGVVVLVVVTGYLRTSLAQLTSADQSHLALSLDTLVDAAADRTLLMLHSGNTAHWQSEGQLRWRTFEDWQLDVDTPASVWVALEEATDGLVMLIHASARQRNGRLIQRTAEIQLNRQSPFIYGLEVHDGFTLNGNNIILDSFDSSNGPYANPGNRNDRLIVLSPATASGSARLNNANLYGSLYVGAADALALGPQSRVRRSQTPSGQRIDDKAIRHDIRLDRPFPVAMPQPEDPILWAGGEAVEIGDRSGFTTESYVFDDLQIRANETVRVVGRVRWYVNGDLHIHGNLVIEEDGDLELYLNGDLHAGGGAILNTSEQSEHLRIFVTSSQPTILQLAGNARFAGAIYAPYANFRLAGGGNNGHFLGAAVLGSIDINGRYQFHFDEALRFAPQPVHRYAVTSWQRPSGNALRLPQRLAEMEEPHFELAQVDY
jgi:hypothetical protein